MNMDNLHGGCSCLMQNKAMTGVNMDRKWSLLFDKNSRLDPRDLRPLVVDGRFLHNFALKPRQVPFSKGDLWQVSFKLLDHFCDPFSPSILATHVPVKQSSANQHNLKPH